MEENNPIEQPLTPNENAQGDPQETITRISGMYQNWFLDYASYVILERAVPALEDGFKPVQRRIMHSMDELEDGRYNKVANIVGNTMKYHPHGDASIGDAIIQLGQKNLLIDTQGSWGNILTGDDAAAPRYIEARLSKFALDVLFSPKVTEWQKSYDGRNDEPVHLPVKFPLLLAQGAEGIAVGLSTKILPHNFNELIDASVLYLEGKPFELYPDFPTAGIMDAAGYNDGMRGGRIRVRARIAQRDKSTLVITEIPFGTTTSSLIDSILKANEKGKIKILKVDDNTAKDVEILVHLPKGISPDKTIDALYAFTDCEVGLSPNACVIKEGTPVFLGVSDLLKYSADRTEELLVAQLKYRLGEVQDALVTASLERIFIENRIYKDKPFEEAACEADALDHVRKRIEAMEDLVFVRPITEADLKRLLEIKMARILRFNIEKHEERIAQLMRDARTIEKHLAHSTQYTIDYYTRLLKEFGAGWTRKTTIARFGTIEATKVIEATEKLYFDREGGFAGTGLKNAEFVAECSLLDEMIVIFRNGTYRITKIEDKKFIGRGEVLYINRFRRNDNRTIYNIIYRQGKKGPWLIKRCSITGISRDKDYNLISDEEGSRITYFSANPNGEAETVRIALKPQPRMRVLTFEKSFSEVPIRGRGAKGNLVTRAEVQRITLKQRGASTLGGRKIWFDRDVMRINYNGQGEFIGEFEAEDRLLVFAKDGSVYTTDFGESNHFPEGTTRVEKFDANKVWSVVYFDKEQDYYYLKRCQIEDSKKPILLQGEGNDLVAYSDVPYARFALIFGGRDEDRPCEEVEAVDFIAVKSIRAKGKRLTTREIVKIEELSPLREPEPTPDTSLEVDEYDFSMSQEEEMEGEGLKQTSLFDHELK